MDEKYELVNKIASSLAKIEILCVFQILSMLCTFTLHSSLQLFTNWKIISYSTTQKLSAIQLHKNCPLYAVLQNKGRFPLGGIFRAE